MERADEFEVCVVLRALVVVACVLAATSCDDLAPGYSRVGVRLEGSSVLVRYVACPDEDVRSVVLYGLDDDAIAPDDDGDVVLWEGSGSDLEALVGSGVVPTISGRALRFEPGFRYLIDVETSENLVGTHSFEVADLGSPEFRVDLRSLSEADFAKQASGSCD